MRFPKYCFYICIAEYYRFFKLFMSYLFVGFNKMFFSPRQGLLIRQTNDLFVYSVLHYSVFANGEVGVFFAHQRIIFPYIHSKLRFYRVILWGFFAGGLSCLYHIAAASPPVWRVVTVPKGVVNRFYNISKLIMLFAHAVITSCFVLQVWKKVF